MRVWDVADNDARARLGATVAVLYELGSLAEPEDGEGNLVIRGYSCPLTAMVPGDPEVCRPAEALLADSVPVHEHHDRGERPRCRFEAALAGDAARGISPSTRYLRAMSLQ